MKKISLLLLTILSSFILVGCKEEESEPNELLPYELYIRDLNGNYGLTSNISFKQTIMDKDGKITYKTFKGYVNLDENYCGKASNFIYYEVSSSDKYTVKHTEDTLYIIDGNNSYYQNVDEVDIDLNMNFNFNDKELFIDLYNKGLMLEESYYHKEIETQYSFFVNDENGVWVKYILWLKFYELYRLSYDYEKDGVFYYNLIEIIDEAPIITKEETTNLYQETFNISFR